MRAAKPKTNKVAGVLGLAFDAEDGHKRLTRGENFLLMGGSHESHFIMQETMVKVNEHLGRKGKRLEDASPGELRDIFEKVVR